MTPTIGDDERRIGRRLRRLVDGPTAHDTARAQTPGRPDSTADTSADTAPDKAADTSAPPAPETVPAGHSGHSGHGGYPSVRAMDTGKTTRVRRVSPRADGLPRGGARFADWRRGDFADLTPDTPADTAPAPDTPPARAADTAPDAPDADTTGPDKPAPGRRRLRLIKPAPAPAAAPPLPPELTKEPPVNGGEEAAPGAPVDRAGESTWWVGTEDGRLEFLIFNGTAAGAGYALGLVPRLELYLPASAQSATGTIAAVLALVAAVLTWRLTRIPYVQSILPMPMLARPLITAAAAEIARRLAPVAIAYPDRYGTRYGLDAHAVSLLLTCGGLAFGLWWLIDRRTVAARWWWGARWIARIPLASVVLATALYAPGNTI